MGIKQRLQRSAGMLDGKNREEIIEMIKSASDDDLAIVVWNAQGYGIDNMPDLHETEYIFEAFDSDYYEEVNTEDGDVAYRPIYTKDLAKIARDNAGAIADACLNDESAMEDIERALS